MALVNPQIAMSFRPTTEYQPRNALAEYAQLQSIVGAQRQAEVADMQLQERNALRQLDPSAPDYERQLFKISPQLGLEFRKEAAATAAQRAAQQKSEFELKVAQRKFGQDLRRGLSANPSNENIVAFGQDAVLQGLYTPEQVKVEVDQLLALPIDERARILSQAGASAAELRPQVVAPGSSLVAGGRTVFTAPDRAQSERPIAVSPGQVLVDASGRQIFTAPERAESQRPIVMSPGQVAIDASGRQIFTAPERVEPQRPMAVSPGQVVIDASGKQIFTAPAAPQRPTAVSPGQVLIDANGQPIFTAPAAPASTRIDLIGVAKGTDTPVYFDKDTRQQFTIGVDATGKQVPVPYTGAVNRSTSTVTATATAAGSRLESAEQKGKGELNVKQYGDIATAARLAARTLPAMETQAKILDQGFTTGFGTEVKKAGASLLAALGVKEAEKFATDAQTFLSATQQAVLQRQLEQKGPQTEADAQRITQTGAQFGNTVAANRFIIDVAKAQLQRDIAQRNFYDDWWANKKTYEGAENAWFSGEGGKSLFDRPELKKYLASPSAGAAPAQSSSVRTQADAILQRK